MSANSSVGGGAMPLRMFFLRTPLAMQSKQDSCLLSVRFCVRLPIIFVDYEALNISKEVRNYLVLSICSFKFSQPNFQMNISFVLLTQGTPGRKHMKYLVRFPESIRLFLL